MATYTNGRRIVRQASSVLISTPASGAGTAVPIYGGQVTFNLPTALYGIWVPRIQVGGAGTANAGMRYMGLQAYNRHSSTYANNTQVDFVTNFILQDGSAASAAALVQTQSNSSGSSNHASLQARRFVAFDGMVPVFRNNFTNATTFEQSTVLGALGLLVFDQDRIQFGFQRSTIFATSAADVVGDLYEVY